MSSFFAANVLSCSVLLLLGCCYWLEWMLVLPHRLLRKFTPRPLPEMGKLYLPAFHIMAPQIYMYIHTYSYIHIKWTRTARYALPLPIWYIIFVFILFTLWMLFVGYVKCDNFMLRLEIDNEECTRIVYYIYTYIWNINMNMIDVVES